MPSINPRRIRWMQIGAAEDFSGGPNVNDAPSELAVNEAEDAWNVTFDERGGVASRLGYAKQNGTPFSGGLVHNVFWSQILSARITQAGAVIYLADTNTARHTFSTSALVTFAELNSLIIACHPVDGFYTSPDGITWTHQTGSNIPAGIGTCMAVWQNKLWVGCTDGSLHFSALGDSTTWASTDFVKLWEKDEQPVVALHVGSGQDILGQAGLLAFKQDSTYRVNDSSTASYETIDATVGAAGPLAVIGLGPKVLTISRHGIYWWATGVAGMQEGTKNRLLPLWSSAQLVLSTQNQWCAARKDPSRVVFSVTTVGSTVNNLAIEYHVGQGWVAPGSNAMSCYANSTGSVDAVYGGSPTASGQVYLLDSTGADDGVAISWRFQTRWFNPAGSFFCTIWKLRGHLRGSGNLTVLKDYATATGGTTTAFAVTGNLPTYDSGLHYDAGLTYGVAVLQGPVEFFSIGTCRQVSFLFSGTSTSTIAGQPVLNAGVGPTLGEFGLFGLEFAWQWLGYKS